MVPLVFSFLVRCLSVTRNELSYEKGTPDLVTLSEKSMGNQKSVCSVKKGTLGLGSISEMSMGNQKRVGSVKMYR